ncbi:MAG: Molybdopterin-guanine dinucleotide biosynthesis adapter protein [Promethearchaeota archaeon]|nr:MAG: Molybdopterin-guanine dinucleotide biosynthesis adapter protein [Candidatus Lokiarchaeota archaeon]
MTNIKIISVIGFSGSGKTQFILDAIKRLREELNLEVAVIKYIHEHMVDKKGKDSYKYTKTGSNYAITKNAMNETTIFLKKEVSIEKIVDWLSKGPYGIDLVFTEGFREIKYPTVLCLKEEGEFESQINENVRLISGLITQKSSQHKEISSIAVIDIRKEFQTFLKVFNLVR